MRLEEEFDTWFARKVPRSPPPPSAMLLPIFLQSSSSAYRHEAPPATPDASDDSADSRSYQSSASSFRSDSFSSEDEEPRDSRWRRERSRRKRSRSRYARRRSRSPRRKHKRSRSSKGEWVWVTIPRSHLLGASAAPSTSGWLPRAPSPPSRHSSSSRPDHRRRSSHQGSSDKHKSAQVPTSSAQRRESPLQPGSFVPASGPSTALPERKNQPAGTGKPAVPWNPAGGSRPMTATLVPAELPMQRVDPPMARHERKVPPPHTEPSVFDVETQAEDQIAEGLVEGARMLDGRGLLL
ncbi:serine/arginine repetitive matrix protein 1-like [Palaemon carinicauda]|uniref:serine/arginine repetitive matrix protein 1-like n=1 Tax=Palaemon carinicauda TaxID=392227 RepID=UPI0035B5CB82